MRSGPRTGLRNGRAPRFGLRTKVGPGHQAGAQPLCYRRAPHPPVGLEPTTSRPEKEPWPAPRAEPTAKRSPADGAGGESRTLGLLITRQAMAAVLQLRRKDSNLRRRWVTATRSTAELLRIGRTGSRHAPGGTHAGFPCLLSTAGPKAHRTDRGARLRPLATRAGLEPASAA